MSLYTVRDVERLLGIRRSLVMQFVTAGLIEPEGRSTSGIRLSFRDLALLRTAARLLSMRIPTRRIKLALTRLRLELPRSISLSSVRVDAVGHGVVLRHGARTWEIDTGQYLLEFDDPLSAAPIELVPTATGADDVDDWLERGAQLESRDAAGATRAYREALRRDPGCVAAYVNLGCLLQESGRDDDALAVYREALAIAPAEALLHFNLGVVLEDLGRASDAAGAYRDALRADPGMADAHFNLARLYESLGEPTRAVRHLAQYRGLTNRGSE